MIPFVLFLLFIVAVQCFVAWILARCFKYVDTVDAIHYAMSNTSETN